MKSENNNVANQKGLYFMYRPEIFFFFIRYYTVSWYFSLSQKHKHLVPLDYKTHQPKRKRVCILQCFYFILFFYLLSAIRNLLWKPKPDLRSRRLDRNAVPANTAFAHLVGVFFGNRIRGLARQVPRQRADQDEAHHSGGHNQHKPSAKASPTDQSTSLDPSNHRHVDRRQVPHHGVT